MMSGVPVNLTGTHAGPSSSWSRFVLPSPSSAETNVDSSTVAPTPQLAPFSGRDCDWEHFKGMATKLFRSLELDNFGSRADLPPSKNAELFQILSGACANGKLSFLLKLHGANQDGHALWQNLLSFYEEEDAMTTVAEAKFEELINLDIGAIPVAELLWKFVRLTDILETTGHGMKHAIQRVWLLQKFRHNSFYTDTIDNLRSRRADLETCIVRLHERSQELSLLQQQERNRSSQKSATSGGDNSSKNDWNQSSNMSGHNVFAGDDNEEFLQRQQDECSPNSNDESDDGGDSSDDEKSLGWRINTGDKRLSFGKKMVPAKMRPHKNIFVNADDDGGNDDDRDGDNDGDKNDEKNGDRDDDRHDDKGDDKEGNEDDDRDVDNADDDDNAENMDVDILNEVEVAVGKMKDDCTRQGEFNDNQEGDERKNDGIAEEKDNDGVDISNANGDVQIETEAPDFNEAPDPPALEVPRRGKTRLQTHSMLEKLFEQERERECAAAHGKKTPSHTPTSPESSTVEGKQAATPSEASAATDASGLDDASIQFDMLDDYIQLFNDFDVDVGVDDDNEDDTMMMSERNSTGKSIVGSGKKRAHDDMSVASSTMEEELVDDDDGNGNGSFTNCFSQPPGMSGKKVPRKNSRASTGKRRSGTTLGGGKSRKLTHSDSDVRSILEEASSTGSDCCKLIASAQNLYVVAKDRALQIIKEKGLSVMTSHLERIRERDLTSSAARLLQTLSCRVVSVVINSCHGDLQADQSLRETVSKSRISMEIMENLKGARKLPAQVNFELVRALVNLTGVDGHDDQFWTLESLKIIAAVMRQHRQHVAIQLEACRRLQAFALVPLSTSKGGDKQKDALMIESGALDAVVVALERHGQHSGDLLEAACGTLLNVIQNREVRIEMGRAIPIILKAVAQFNSVEEGSTTCSGSERTSNRKGRRHQVPEDINPTFFLAAYGAIHNLVLGCHDNGRKAVANGGVDVILQTMSRHGGNEKMQERICILLSHLAWIPRAVSYLSESYIFGALLVALHRHIESEIIVENALGILKYLDFYFVPNDWYSKLSWSFGAPSTDVVPVTGIDEETFDGKKWCRPCTAAVHLIIAAWRSHEKNDRINGNIQQALHNISEGVNGRKNPEVLGVLKEKGLESLLRKSEVVVKLEPTMNELQDITDGKTANDAINLASDSEGEDDYHSCS